MRQGPRLLGAAAAAAGLVVLAGWWLDIGLLATALPGWPPTRPDTALAFALAGAALLCLPDASPEARTSRLQRVGLGCGLGTGAIGLLTFAEYALFPELGIDGLLVGGVNQLDGAAVDVRPPRLVGEDVSISTTVAPDLGLVRADRGQMEQVVMNLVVNARDAMPQGGRIDISVENAAGDTGRHVRLSVSDTGEGIPPDVQDRIFEPFFTTKAHGKGTGLGLSMVHGIVSQAGGVTTVESQVGRGATFRVLLPRCEDGEQATVSPVPHTQRAEGHETVLLVEDSDGVRRLAATILARLGYRVIAAADGTDALRICEEYEGDLHLLLTDVIMRTMTGPELARLVRRMYPSIRILYMSGYADRGLDPEELARHGAVFVGKPFTVDELGAKVREAFGQPGHEPRHDG